MLKIPIIFCPLFFILLYRLTLSFRALKSQIGQMDSLALHMDVNFKDISRIIEFLNTLNDDSFDKPYPFLGSVAWG